MYWLYTQTVYWRHSFPPLSAQQLVSPGETTMQPLPEQVSPNQNIGPLSPDPSHLIIVSASWQQGRSVDGSQGFPCVAVQNGSRNVAWQKELFVYSMTNFSRFIKTENRVSSRGLEAHVLLLFGVYSFFLILVQNFKLFKITYIKSILHPYCESHRKMNSQNWYQLSFALHEQREPHRTWYVLI